MEDRFAKGYLLPGFCVYRAWGMSSYWRCKSYSIGVQLPTGALWFRKVQTNPHLQSGFEVSPISMSLLKYLFSYILYISMLLMYNLIPNYYLCLYVCLFRVLHIQYTLLISGEGLQIGTTRLLVTFVPQKLPGFAILFSHWSPKAQRPKSKTCQLCVLPLLRLCLIDISDGLAQCINSTSDLKHRRRNALKMILNSCTCTATKEAM